MPVINVISLQLGMFGLRSAKDATSLLALAFFFGDISYKSHSITISGGPPCRLKMTVGCGLGWDATCLWRIFQVGFKGFLAAKSSERFREMQRGKGAETRNLRG